MLIAPLGELALGEIESQSTTTPTVIADGGCVGWLFGSLGEFSLGEYCVTVTPPIPPTPTIVQSGGFAMPLIKGRKKILDEDELLVILLSQQIAQTFWKEDKKN